MENKDKKHQKYISASEVRNTITKTGKKTWIDGWFCPMFNSIAHCNLYLSNAGNRKYILFEDYNKSGNITARVLLSQADLSLLKREIMK